MSKEVKVFYTCDKKKCDNACIYCEHTQDINHAKNFERIETETEILYFEGGLYQDEYGNEDDD